MTPKRPPTWVWFGQVSTYGIGFTTPLRAKYNSRLKRWFVTDNEEFPHLNGNAGVDHLGIHYDKDHRFVSFASTKKEEVQHWIRGVRSMITVLKFMTSNSLDSKDVLA